MISRGQSFSPKLSTFLIQHGCAWIPRVMTSRVSPRQRFSRDVPVKEGRWWCGYPPAPFDSCERAEPSVQKPPNPTQTPKSGSTGGARKEFRVSCQWAFLGTCVFLDDLWRIFQSCLSVWWESLFLGLVAESLSFCRLHLASRTGQWVFNISWTELKQ